MTRAATMKTSIGGPNGQSLPSQTGLMRMQVAELLQEQTPNYDSHSNKAEGLIREIRRTLQSLAPRDPLRASDIQDAFKKHSQVSIPFPAALPPDNAQHRYVFAPPENMNVVGSHGLQIGTRRGHDSCIDLAVTMPHLTLAEKDYLDYRYIHKKAYYLACLAVGLAANSNLSQGLSYSFRDGNELQPCILVTAREAQETKKSRQSAVRILVGPPSSAFKKEKLRPWTSCIRAQSWGKEGDSGPNQVSTPLYNGTVASECLLEPYFSLLRTTAQRASGFRDACKLLRLWLRQRDLGSKIELGGFGNFESACCLALLLQGDGSRVTASFVSNESDGFQLFRSTLQLLAHRDLVKEPLILGKAIAIPTSVPALIPLLYDGLNEHNVLFKMSTASYWRLKAAAQTSIEALTQPEPYRFHPTFIARLGDPLLRFDHVLRGHLTSEPSMIVSNLNRLHDVLSTAFGDRTRLIDIQHRDREGSTEWACTSCPPSPPNQHEILVGILANSDHIARRVDLGPFADDAIAASKYREFWGEKAELRRFANGEIRESVTWPAPSGDTDILDVMTAHAIRRHFSNNTVSLSGCAGGDFTRLLPPRTTTAQALQPFEKIERASARLQGSIRSVSGHPLRLRQVSASTPGLRYASLVSVTEKTQQPIREPLDMVVQFEGSVRWPEDITAIQHTKIALLSKMSELLRTEEHIDSVVGMENSESLLLNRAFLQVDVDNITFRLRIHHDREASLLEHQIKDKALAPKEREQAVIALSAYKGTFLHSPRHTQAIRDLCAKTPVLSLTMRLLKLWVSSHLLDSHFPDELLELIAAHTFTSPFPYAFPGSLRSAFLRSLSFIAKWDWQNEPLIVSLANTALSRTDLEDITTSFQAWRKIDPGMHRVALFVASNIEHDGTAWTSIKPSVVAVNRLVSLAKAACGLATKKGLELEAEPLFSPSLEEFDFVIHLNPSWHKNRVSISEAPSFGIAFENHAALAFIKELEQLFPGYVVFFHNRGAAPLIGCLWIPRSFAQEWTVSSSWATRPLEGSKEEAVAMLNKNEILYQIGTLGGELISRIIQQSRD